MAKGFNLKEMSRPKLIGIIGTAVVVLTLVSFVMDHCHKQGLIVGDWTTDSYKDASGKALMHIYGSGSFRFANAYGSWSYFNHKISLNRFGSNSEWVFDVNENFDTLTDQAQSGTTFNKVK